MKISAYLKLSRHHIYVFRRRIPKNLLEFFETNELRISTRTSDRKKAITLSRNYAIQSDFLYEQLRQALTMSENDKHLNLKLITSEWLIKHLRSERLEKEEIIESQQAAFIKQRAELEREHDAEMARVQSHHDILLNINNTLALNRTVRESNQPEVNFKLSELVEDFLSVNSILRRKDKPATVRKDKDALNRFIAIIGDKKIAEISQLEALEFAEKIPTYGLINKSRAANTINGYLSSISKFSGWVAAYHPEIKHKELEFDKYRHKKTTRSADDREMFSDDEIRAIFKHPKFLQFQSKNDPKFWLITIAAYTGMRLEEITQLNPCEDIYLEENDIWVFNINEKDAKSLKNSASPRVIPIHSKLLELNILDFIKKLKVKNASRLFPDTLIRDGRTGKNIGKNTNRFIQKIVGIEGKSNHSFRHTVATKLKRAGVDISIAAQILGHAYGGETYGTYGKSHTIKVTRDALENVNFGGINS